MRHSRLLLSCAAVMVSRVLVPLSVLAQGPLSPPGSPSPTMKSLDQIEPRMPISSLPFNITNSGSYYLTTNLNFVGGNGITISANNVTVDLNGFTLTGTINGYGIYFPPTAQTNVTVRNGSMSGWDYGVFVSGGAGNSRNIALEYLTVSSCVNYGISSSSPALVRHCLCVGNGYLGIISSGGQITDCDASNNGHDGIDATDCVVRNCRAANNAWYGIYVARGTVSACWVENNGHSGIYVTAAGTEVVGNNCFENNLSAGASDAGIYVDNANNRIEDNHVSASGYAGISVTNGYSGNIVVENSVSGNGANNYLLPTNQVFGPLITTYGIITNSNPWANFSF